MLHGEADLGVLAALLLGGADSLLEEVSADALATILELRCPGADDAPPTTEVMLGAAPPLAYEGRVGLQPQHEGADDAVAVSGAYDDVLFTAVRTLLLQPGPAHAFRQADVPIGKVPYGEQVRHGHAARQRDGGPGIAIAELVRGSQTKGVARQADGVGDEGLGGALAHLSHRVGHEVQALDHILGFVEGLQGQRGDVVEGHEGRVGGQGRGGGGDEAAGTAAATDAAVAAVAVHGC